MVVYALTIFIGAFLLFEVQPLIGKYILPWFGGGPGVWTTCMLFFQVALLGGYAYAHASSRWLKPRSQVWLHLALLGAALISLPIVPSNSWKPYGTTEPTGRILLLLAATLGLPYFILSSTSPLLQQWFARTNPGQSPYRLFALSNTGSLLALLSFPFYTETHFTRKTQAISWSWGFVLYVAACALCALKAWRSARAPVTSAVSPQSAAAPENSVLPTESNSAFLQPTLVQRLLWLLLPACASVLLLATTNKICLDVAVIPFLWVLPLALYLLSFIICFDSPRWYVRFPFTLALTAALVALCWALFKGSDASLYQQILAYCGALFICCMVCHGELYRLRPNPTSLTSYYLMIAAGGALGGLLVAVGAPLILPDYYELHFGVFLCALLFFVVCIRRRDQIGEVHWRWIAAGLTLAVLIGLDQSIVWMGREMKSAKPLVLAMRIGTWLLFAAIASSWIIRKSYKHFRYPQLIACAWLFAGLFALGTILWKNIRDSGNEAINRARNFYGVLTVFEHNKDDPDNHHLVLQHGRITHGLQFVESDAATRPTTYYGSASGIGRAVSALPAGAHRIGVVGLGTGSMMVYGHAGDYARFYEIDPHVRRLATTLFRYFTNCPAKVDIALGDARLSMENEPPQHFDLLVLDAFSSDAIPVHLLTREAFDIYDRHMATNGIIAVHISNHYLNLEPVVRNIARHFHYQLAVIDYDEADNEEEWWLYSSTWILLTRDSNILKLPVISAGANPANTNAIPVPLWTDDFASLFQILK
jgi:hypothetical protein